MSDDNDHDDLCESEFITGPMAWLPCRCRERAEVRVSPNTEGGNE